MGNTVSSIDFSLILIVIVKLIVFDERSDVKVIDRTGKKKKKLKV